MNIGFGQPLYIQPFDHRGSFQTKMFGWKGKLTREQTAEIAAAKQVIYDGFKAAVIRLSALWEAPSVHVRTAGPGREGAARLSNQKRKATQQWIQSYSQQWRRFFSLFRL
jgi:hypothetical protein